MPLRSHTDELHNGRASDGFAGPENSGKVFENGPEREFRAISFSDRAAFVQPALGVEVGGARQRRILEPT